MFYYNEKDNLKIPKPLKTRMTTQIPPLIATFFPQVHSLTTGMKKDKSTVNQVVMSLYGGRSRSVAGGL